MTFLFSRSGFLRFLKARLPVLALGLVLLGGSAAVTHAADTYTVSNGQILVNGIARAFRGANTLHVFGGNSGGTDAYRMDMVRVFVGNLKEQPLSGYTIQDSNGSYLHPLQDVVNDNRAHGKVSIICPFNWDGTSATKFTGLYPAWQSFFSDYKLRMQAIARQFQNQPDVWIELWNEPYPYDGAGGYSQYSADHSWWRDDMETMIGNLRGAGYTGIIVVPGSAQGQSEDSLLARGQEVLNWDPQHKLVFDVHAYEQWLLSNTQAQIAARIKAVQDKGLALVFGKLGPMNAGTLMNPADFLTAADARGVSVTAWLWKQDAGDPDALQKADGTPNDNANNHWGTLYRDFCLAPHSVLSSIAEGDYKLTNKYSGRLLDVRGGSLSDGAAVVQMSASGGSSQIWHIKADGSGYYTLANKNSGEMLDVGGASMVDGGLLDQWPDNTGSNQRWSLKAVGGYYSLLNRNSGKAIEAAGWSNADNGTVDQWINYGNDNQLWALTDPPASALMPPAGLRAVGGSVGSRKIAVSWAAVTGADSYRVYRSVGLSAPYTLVATLKTVTFSDTGLTSGTTYYYKVTAAGAAGTSMPAGPVTAKAE